MNEELVVETIMEKRNNRLEKLTEAKRAGKMAYIYFVKDRLIDRLSGDWLIIGGETKIGLKSAAVKWSLQQNVLK